MQSRYADFERAGARILAVSVDPPQRSREIVEQYELSFPILSDTDGAAIDAFGVRHASGGIEGNDIARPAVFLFDSSGQLVWRELTDNWRVRPRPESLLAQLDAID